MDLQKDVLKSDSRVRQIYFDRESKRAEHRLDHSAPELGVKKLLSTLPGQPIELVRTPRYSSHDLIKEMTDLGCRVTSVAAPIYGVPRQTTRSLDNSDFLKGYLPFYDDLSHYVSIHAKVGKLANLIKSNVDKSFPRMSEEHEDDSKISVQRTHIYGHLNTFVAPKPLAVPHPETLEGISAVVKKYSKVAERYSFEQGMITDFDPFETQTGMPLKARGTATELARVAMCLAAPHEVDDPIDYLRKLDRMWGNPLALPPGAVYSSLLAHRQGPYRKTTKLWYSMPGQFESQYESKGIYSRLRNVFPAPYVMNFMMSSCYKTMSSARMNTPGLWHTPDRQEQYVNALRKQGKYCYAIDFSAMDTYITKFMVKHLADEMINSGFDPKGFGILGALVMNMGLLVPSLLNDSTTTYIQNYIPWPSGLKTTSEVDSVIGQAIPMLCLKRQDPKYWDDWLEGKFVLLNQGDDVLVTTPRPIDMDRFVKDAEELGFPISVLEDNSMFLKTLLPVKGYLSQPTKPWSRVVQQTFFNEDAYDGKPDAIMKLALNSRLASIIHNPLTPIIGPEFLKVLFDLKWARSITKEQKTQLSSTYSMKLTDQDNTDILTYAVNSDNWLSQMVARSQYEPSAANFMIQFNAIQNASQATAAVTSHAIALRKIARTAFFTRPTAKSLSEMFALRDWDRQGTIVR